MIRVVLAEYLQVGDVVHLHSHANITRIRLTSITRRTKTFQCVGFRADDPHQVSPWSFSVQFRQPVEIDDLDAPVDLGTGSNLGDVGDHTVRTRLNVERWTEFLLRCRHHS